MVCLCFIAEEKKGRRFDLMHVYSQDDYINAAADQLVLAWRINAVDVSLLAKIKIICFQVVVSRGHSYLYFFFWTSVNCWDRIQTQFNFGLILLVCVEPQPVPWSCFRLSPARRPQFCLVPSPLMENGLSRGKTLITLSVTNIHTHENHFLQCFHPIIPPASATNYWYLYLSGHV